MKRTNKIALYFVPILAIALVFVLSTINAKAEDYKCQQIGQTDSTVSVSWDEVANAEAYYFGWGETVQKAHENVDKQQDKCDAQYISRTISGLKAGTKYYLCINCKIKSGSYITPIVTDFEIYTLPSGKTTGVKVDNIDQSLKTATLSWKEQTGVSGYEYKLLADGKTVESGSTVNSGDTQVTLDIKKNSFYTFKVRAYSDRAGSRKYGKWSTELNFAPQPNLTKASTSRSGLVVKWDKITGAKNYTVYASTSANKGYKKVTTTTKTSYTLSKINGKKFNKSNTYYIYVIANKSVSGKTISSTKSAYAAVRDNVITPGVF